MPKVNIKNGFFALMAIGLIGSSIAPSFAGEFSDNHPRRAEVLAKDAGLNNQIQADKGHLGGHYRHLRRRSRAIRRQERRQARINGGYLTKGQQHHLNHEENHLQHEINRDKH